MPQPIIQNKELRTSGTLERRDAKNGIAMLAGHAAVFNEWADIGRHWRECVKPGAFARAIKEKQDVRALVDHDASRIIGRTKAGTLRLAEGQRGLEVEIDVADTQVGRDLVTLVDRGDVSQMSFGFVVRVQEWEEDDDGNVSRSITDVDLYDVSPVTYPAYEGTDIAKRSLDAFLAERAGNSAHIARRMRMDLSARVRHLKLIGES